MEPGAVIIVDIYPCPTRCAFAIAARSRISPGRLGPALTQQAAFHTHAVPAG